MKIANIIKKKKKKKKKKTLFGLRVYDFIAEYDVNQQGS